jgi:amino acid transporter
MAIRLNPFMVLAWLLALMLSPETLAALGRLAGRYGPAFGLPLVGALLLHGLNIAAGPWSRAMTPRGGVLEDFSASLRPLVALPVVAVCTATAVLVTSGFVFNEVFVFWFPNFGFAALLLAVLLAVNLGGPRSAAVAQALLTTTALIGLIVLTLTGLFVPHSGTPEAEAAAGRLDLRGLGLGLVAFLGYDLIRYVAPNLDRRRVRPFMFVAVACGAFTMWAWNITALIHLPPSRLADTSIPHILAAKAIMGQNGRIVMGIVVIAGSLAATNLLFRAAARMLAGRIENGLMRPVAGFSPTRPWLPLIALTGLSGLLMAAGFAGSNWLDVSLRAGLILWLIGMGLDHLPPLLNGHGRNGEKTAQRMVVHLILLVSMTTLGIVLVMTDENSGMLVRALIILTAIAAVMAAIGRFAAGRQTTNRHRKASLNKEGV